jgi:hypothetical protein
MPIILVFSSSTKNLDTRKYIGGVFSGTYTSPKLLSVGMYFLLPEYRGLGLGLPLWDRAIAGDVENKALIAGLLLERKLL